MTKPVNAQAVIADGMRILWDVDITMDDGIILKADIFLPVAEGRYPVLLTYGPYAKGLAFQDGYPSAWAEMIAHHPDVAYGSSNKYQNWEVVDPEKWVPHGYVCVRVDSRGAGRSPGYIDHYSPRETQDYYACIEWAGVQPWSSGKVGLNGISYYGSNQWHVASLKPPHLAAMCIWEGFADFYRDGAYHGGILCTFFANWYDMQVKTVQYGQGVRGPRSALNGLLVCGDETLSDKQLEQNRSSFGDEILAHPLCDDWHQARAPQWDAIETPFLSAGNWGGQGLHPRGNCEGFMRAASQQKWLEIHGLEHWTHFYTDYGRMLQLRFFDHFLKGETNGWDQEPRVRLNVRHIDHFEERLEHEWPLARTQWTPLHLHGGYQTLAAHKPTTSETVNFRGMGDGLTFISEPMAQQTEITGPVAARLTLSSSTSDADLFLVVRVFTPDLREVTFAGAIDPHTPIFQGWLRASHRKLDPALSKPWRPYHTHDEHQPLTPGVPVTVDVEFWPSGIVVPQGYRVALSIRGKDYIWQEKTGKKLSNFKNELLGCGPFLHNDPRDRPPEIFDGITSLHLGPDHDNYLLLPIIP